MKTPHYLKFSDFKIEVIVGPEFLTGSSRLESWNCSKVDFEYDFYYINDFRWSRKREYKMIDMQMSNAKLNKRARRILMEELGVDERQS